MSASPIHDWRGHTEKPMKEECSYRGEKCRVRKCQERRKKQQMINFPRERKCQARRNILLLNSQAEYDLANWWKRKNPKKKKKKSKNGDKGQVKV